jgi:iron complex transport system substrate-binding protein
VRTIIRTAVILLIIGLAAAGCAPAADNGPEKRILTDQAGREVAVPEKIERLVALDTGLCGILLALGEWDKVVGTTRYTVLDDLLMDVIPGLDRVPTPGTSTDVSIESLLALNPDVVIGGWEIDFIHQMEAAGITALYVEPVTFEDEFEEILLMGRLLNKEAEAEALAVWMQEKLNLIASATGGGVPVRTLYLWGDPADPKSMGTFGGAPDIRNEMLDYAGGINVAGGIAQRWPNVSLEQVLEWDPEVIIVWGWADRLEPDDFLDHPDWQPVSAVRDGRVYKLPRWSSWSPPEVIMVLQMARWLHPDLTAALDPEQWLDELLEEFYRMEK